MTREGVTVLACSLLQIIAAGRNVAVCKSEIIKRGDRSLLIAGEGWDGGRGGGNSGYFGRVTIKFTLPSCEKENAPRTSKYFIFE